MVTVFTQFRANTCVGPPQASIQPGPLPAVNQSRLPGSFRTMAKHRDTKGLPDACRTQSCRRHSMALDYCLRYFGREFIFKSHHIILNGIGIPLWSVLNCGLKPIKPRPFLFVRIWCKMIEFRNDYCLRYFGREFKSSSITLVRVGILPT
jgi:hypothetical protein